jgi:predicted HTH transcriptional regulator
MRRAEKSHIEYKLDIFERVDEKDGYKLLDGLAAFANADGGDILIGVDADNGMLIRHLGGCFRRGRRDFATPADHT